MSLLDSMQEINQKNKIYLQYVHTVVPQNQRVAYETLYTKIFHQNTSKMKAFG